MSLNPLNELKRRLDDDSTPLPKRLCLAKNVIHSAHFPAAPKERIVGDWLEDITDSNGFSNKEIKDIIGWLQFSDDLTNDLKCRLIKVFSQHLRSNPLNLDDVPNIIQFLENDKISTCLSQQVDDYLFITSTLVQNLHNDNSDRGGLVRKIFQNLVKYYRECKKKLEFIVKLIDGENLETLFSYLETDHRNTVLEVCKTILFPITKKSFFASFLQNLIKKDSIDELIAQKGDSIQSVIKIMSSFFMFPKGRTEQDPKFLIDFLDVFVTCYRSESLMIFTFYIMAVNSLNMIQHYLNPAMRMPAIKFQENDEKVKRNIFLKMLNALLNNEVDINVKLTDTVGDRLSKVEMKKNFMSFIKATMMGLLKLQGKPDKATLQIVKTALSLDPSIIEQKLDIILPPIIISKKSSSVTEAYIEMLNCLIETLFKLSRGTTFINQLLTHTKSNLEALNVEQFELRQKLTDVSIENDDKEKIKSKIIAGNDIFPQECVEMYGKWTSELMFRQNKGLLISLQKDLEENCLMMLDEGFVSPSIITLAEILSAILSSFFRYSKMADHTVPQPISEEFWLAFEKFEQKCLKKFGKCVLKLNYNPPLVLSFLKLCLSYAQLKLLYLKYGNTKPKEIDVDSTTEVLDCSVILSCLNCKQWTCLAEMIREDESVIVWDNLLLIKTMTIELLNINHLDNNQSEVVTETKTHLIKNLSSCPEVITNNTYYTRELFMNLESNQAKQLAKSLVKLYLKGERLDLFKDVAITKNRILSKALVLEITKNIIKFFDNLTSLSKGMNKIDFDITKFLQTVNIKDYFDNLTLNNDNEEEITKYLDIMKDIQIHNLEERYQLAAIFTLLALKKCCQLKKIKRNIDRILQSIYELSPKCPDLYKILPVDYIFSVNNNIILNLLTLSIKSSNSTLIIKSILESAVKKVKTDSEIVKNLVEILLSGGKLSKNLDLSVEYFSDTIFQLQCTILPIIAKEKKAITTSAFRSILANLQERLHQAMLEAFKRVDFTKNGSFGSDDSYAATLNAIGAYSLTLLKYCELTDVNELKKYDCLWSGLDFFVRNALKAVEDPECKQQHVDSSIQLLNIMLRHTKKFEGHNVFRDREALYKQIWNCLKARSLLVFDGNSKRRLNESLLEAMAMTLKQVAENISVDCFTTQFVGDITSLATLKKPSVILKSEEITNSQLTSHRTAKYLLHHCLKANIVGPKCLAITKQMYRVCKTLKLWIERHYGGENIENKMADAQLDNKMANVRPEDKMAANPDLNAEQSVQSSVKLEDAICDLLGVHLEMLSEVVSAAKKIPLDYRFLDAIFELQHTMQYILGRNTVDIKYEISWQAFFTLQEGCMLVLNNLLLSREELLEDRWPCYMQCYKALIFCLCERTSSLEQTDRWAEQKLAESAHSIEKITQSICKRKNHVSRIAAYAVADICTWIEKTPPPKSVRQHLENSIALLIQASDSTYAMAFLKRALAGSIGQMTMANMYSMYKRYHKYVGNS